MSSSSMFNWVMVVLYFFGFPIGTMLSFLLYYFNISKESEKSEVKTVLNWFCMIANFTGSIFCLLASFGMFLSLFSFTGVEGAMAGISMILFFVSIFTGAQGYGFYKFNVKPFSQSVSSSEKHE